MTNTEFKNHLKSLSTEEKRAFASNFFGVSIDQVKKQYKANADELRECRDKAKVTGTYRNRTVSQWQKDLDKYVKLSK